MKKVRSLRGKLIPAFFLAALFSIGIFAVVSQIRLRNSMKENLNWQMETNLNNANRSLCMVLDKYETILYDLSTDDDVIEIMEAINNKEDDLDINSMRLRHELSHICNRNAGVNGIMILPANGSPVFYDRLASSSIKSNWISPDMIKTSSDIESYQPGNGIIMAGDHEFSNFHIVRYFIDYRDINREIGTVTLSVDEAMLQQALNGQKQNLVYVCDGDQIVSGPYTSEVGRNIHDISTDGYQRTSVVNEITGWTVWNFSSVKQYRKTMAEQSLFLFLSAVGTIGILVALVYLATRPMMGAVETVVSAMTVAETGDFSVRIHPQEKTPREIQRIAVGFNEMVEHMGNLVEQVKRSALEQKNAEISALEAQIDPHFLYNTLDTINWKAIEREEFEISQMVGALADILRYTVKNAGEETTIVKEIYWLEQYILLEKEKLGKPLETIIDVSEEVMHYRIHKLLLQPFVENAIKHGLAGSDRPCRLKVCIKASAGQLHVMIKDSGKGIDPEQLMKLNADNTDLGDHFGVANVRKRLKLYYGEEGEIYFESQLGAYTKVHLFLPIIKKGEEE